MLSVQPGSSLGWGPSLRMDEDGGPMARTQIYKGAWVSLLTAHVEPANLTYYVCGSVVAI